VPIEEIRQFAQFTKLNLKIADSKTMLDNISFVAADLKRIPPYGPEETNACTITDRQKHLEAEVAKLAASHQASLEMLSGMATENVANKDVVISLVDKVVCKIGECMSSVQGKLDSLNTVVNELRNMCRSTVNANSDREFCTEEEIRHIIFTVLGRSGTGTNRKLLQPGENLEYL